MKTSIKFLSGIFAFLLVSFTILNNVIEQIGLTHKIAQEQIIKNFIGDFDNQAINEHSYKDDGSVRFQMKFFKIPRINNLASLDKKAATLELCQYVKNYVNSQEFIDEYQKLRERAKPTSEPYRMSANEIRTMEQAVSQAENAMKSATSHMTKEQKAEAKKALDNQKKAIEFMKDPTPNKTYWEKTYPQNPETMVKNRLNEYLSLVKTVDFEAKLVTNGKYKKFVNPEYEAKSLKWKAIYRAGKENNALVTSFINQWLKGDVISDEKVKLTSDTIKNLNKDSKTIDSSTSTKESEKILNNIKQKKNNLLNKVKEKTKF